MQQIEVLSVHPSQDPHFKVIYTSRSSRRRKELPVVGAVLTKVTGLDCFTPVATYRLSPAFIFGDDVVLGEAYWDPAKDGGEITVTVKRRNKARKSCSTKGSDLPC